MFTRFALLALAVRYAAALTKCVDGVNNVLPVHDVGGEDALVKFENVELLTYDEGKQPHCEEGMASVRFPGFIKPRSGNVKIEQALRKEDGPLIVEVSAEQDSYLIGEICDKGMSKNRYLKDADCQVDLCNFFGDQSCHVLRKAAKLTLDDMPEGVRGFTATPAATTEMLTGDWKVTLYLKQAGKVVGAALVGKPKQWFKVSVATSFREEL